MNDSLSAKPPASNQAVAPRPRAEDVDRLVEGLQKVRKLFG